MISRGLNSSVLVNISHGSFAEACFSFSVVGLDNHPLERWFLRPLVSLYEDKNGMNTGHIPPGQAILLPDIPGLLYHEHPLFSAIFRHHAADRIEPFPLCGQ